MAGIIADLRFGWRTMRARPLFASIAVVSLALGVGANTAIFSVVESSLMRGLPYKDAGQLVRINTSTPQWDISSMSAPEWLDYQRQTKALAGLAAFTSQSMILTGVDHARKLQGTSVTTNFFEVLGARAERGRLISPAIDRLDADTRAAVISDGLWRSVFGADPKIVGRDVTLSGKSFQIVGVLAPKQEYPNRYEIWTSPRIAVPEQRETAGPNKHIESYGEYYLTGLGRMKPGMTLGQARAEPAVVFKRINTLHPMAKYDAPLLQPLQDTMVDKVRPALWVLLAAVVLLRCG